MRMRSLGAWIRNWGLVLALCVGASAHAGLVVTISATGTITQGTDTSGELTGTAVTPLAGQQVTLVQTLEAGTGSLVDASSDPSSSIFDLVSLSVALGPGLPHVYVGGGTTGGATYGLDTGTTSLDSQLTILLGGDTLTSIVDVVSNLIDSASPTTPFTFTGSFGAGSFVSADRTDDGGATLWMFEIASTGLRSVVVAVSNDVPEPGTAGLLVVAVLAHAGARVRRRFRHAILH